MEGINYLKEIEGIKKRNQERLELLNENRNRMFSYYESMRCLNKSRSEIIESSKYKQLMEESFSHPRNRNRVYFSRSFS